MTMQIAIEAHGNQFLLASDRKIRSGTGELVQTAKPRGPVNQSKIRIAERHNLAVAISGEHQPEADPLQEFTDYISQLTELPHDMSTVIGDWGDKYQKHYDKGWKFSLLIVNPNSNHTAIWEAEVSNAVTVSPYGKYHITGDILNPAVMWPEYFRCGTQPLQDLEIAINIAAMTILMGGVFNSFGIGDLEIWAYTDIWRLVRRDKLNAIGDRFAHLKQEIMNFVHAPSNSAKLQT